MKRILPSIILAAGALAASLLTTAVEANTTRITGSNGHKYQGITINRTPTGAQNACVALGAHLAVIDGSAEISDISSVAFQIVGADFWMGTSIPANTFDRVNVTGSPYYPAGTAMPVPYGYPPLTTTQYLGVTALSNQISFAWYPSSQKYYICEWE